MGNSLSMKFCKLIVLCVMFLCLHVEADAIIVESGSCGDHVSYTLDDMGNLVISGSGMINNNAFQYAFSNYQTNINAVIEEGVTGIGKQAFWGCQNLESISLPNSLTSIGASAFKGGCTSLKSITIPAGVDRINEGTFFGCSTLSSVTFLGNIESVDYQAFAHCYSLTGITLPDSLTSLGISAFTSCTNLQSISIPAGVTKLEESTFYNCNSLSTITLPAGLTEIAGYNFPAAYNVSLENVYFNGSKVEWNNVVIGDNNGSILGLNIVCEDGVICYEHSWDAGTIVVPSNCLEEGTKRYTCTVCNEIKEEIVPANGHTEEIIPAVAPTCTEVGRTEGKKCSVCGKILVPQRTLPILGHTLVNIPAVAPTCTDPGLTEKKKCSVCGKIIVSQNTVPANGHTEEVISAVAPKCTETGLTEGKKCTVCEQILIEQEVVPANGHSEEIIPAVAPTCTETGLTEGKKCSVCEQMLTEQETITPKGHTAITVQGKEATCTEPGLTDGQKCSVCEEILKVQETIPAKGHAFGEWIVVKEATYDTEGMEQRVCEHDSTHIETRIIEKKVKPAETEVKPEEANPAQPGTQTPTQPGTQTPTQPGTQTPTQPETQSPTQPETQAPAKPESQASPQTEKTPAVPVTPETEINEAAAPTASAQQKKILAQKNDNDPKGSTFSSLQAKAVKVTKSSIRIQWKKVKGASRYVVYGNKCGKNNHYKKLKTVKTTSYTQKKLKKGTYYKYLVVAIKGSKAIATSKTIHVATSGGKVGNSKSVKVNKKTFIINVGKKITLKATAVAASKKLKVKKHRAIAFESSNKNIATVSKKGVIKGVRKGKCYVYAYAQNGVMAKVKVVVN